MQTVLIYYIPFQSQQKTVKQVVKALQGLYKLSPQNVRIEQKDKLFCAYVELPENIANQVIDKKTLDVAGQVAHVRRYYSDFQIFINKLETTLDKKDVIQYFSKFGKIDEVQITESHEIQNKVVNRHCYVKFHDQQIANKCILLKKHTFKNNQIKLARTYRIGENENTDKKVFINISPSTTDNTQIQQFLNTQLSKYGELRQRVKFEHITKSNTKAVFTNKKAYDNTLNSLKNLIFGNHKIELKPFISRESINKIFLSRLKDDITTDTLQKAFSVFGKINECTLIQSKFAGLNATISFNTQQSYKRSLSQSQQIKQIKSLFFNVPYITVYMSQQDKKDFIQFQKKQHRPKKSQQQQNFMSNPGFIPSMYSGMNPSMNIGMNPMNMGMNPINIGMNPMNIGINPMYPNMNPMFGGMNSNLIRPTNEMNKKV